jgi:hypothetical protein
MTDTQAVTCPLCQRPLDGKVTCHHLSYGQKIETRRFTGRCMLIIAPSLACPAARSMCALTKLPVAKAGIAARCLCVFITPRYQSKETEYAESFGSCVTRVKPSWWAWAMRRRSKGSLWCRGKLSKA